MYPMSEIKGIGQLKRQRGGRVRGRLYRFDMNHRRNRVRLVKSGMRIFIEAFRKECMSDIKNMSVGCR